MGEHLSKFISGWFHHNHSFLHFVYGSDGVDVYGHLLFKWDHTRHGVFKLSDRKREMFIEKIFAVNYCMSGDR